MADYKELQTRIITRHDTEANWENQTWIPLEGEVIIYDPDYSSTNTTGFKYPRFKVGDGINTPSGLPFASMPDVELDISEFKDSNGNQLDPNKYVLTGFKITNAGQIEGHFSSAISDNLATLTDSVLTKASDLSPSANQIPKFLNDNSSTLTNSAITIEKTSNSEVIVIPAGNKKIVLGYTTDQSDGTSFVGSLFDSTATSYPYSSGLAIGGTSGNLLWKGSPVVTTEHAHKVTHTPNGTISRPTFTGTEAGHTHTFTSTSESHTHTFTGTAASHGHTFTGTGTLIKANFTGTQSTASTEYTPAGTVSAPTITVIPNTTTVNSITDVGILPSASLTDGNAVLNKSISNGPNRAVTLSLGYTAPVLTFNAGTLPSKGSDTTVVTDVKSASSTQPTFTGTEATISHTYMPKGSVTITTKTPDSGETANYTPTGTITEAVLTLEGTISSESVSISGTTGETNITPAGTVSSPIFTGTQATITTTSGSLN